MGLNHACETLDSTLFLKILIYMCMDVLSAHMYVHYVGTVPVEARECQVPKTGATGHCELHVGAGNPSPVPGKANARNY